jgi:hypothetical protein
MLRPMRTLLRLTALLRGTRFEVKAFVLSCTREPAPVRSGSVDSAARHDTAARVKVALETQTVKPGTDRTPLQSHTQALPVNRNDDRSVIAFAPGQHHIVAKTRFYPTVETPTFLFGHLRMVKWTAQGLNYEVVGQGMTLDGNPSTIRTPDTWRGRRKSKRFVRLELRIVRLVFEVDRVQRPPWRSAGDGPQRANG